MMSSSYDKMLDYGRKEERGKKERAKVQTGDCAT